MPVSLNACAALLLAFAHLDPNGDGRILPHEAWADETVERRFALADIDHNGSLDAAEFAELIASAPRPPSRRS